MRNSPRLTFPEVEIKSWDTLAGWFRRHEISLFFALTFLFSWLIYAALSLTSFENETTYRRILGIAGFGPSLSAILLSRILFSEKRKSSDTHRFSITRNILLPLSIFIFVAGSEWWNNIWWDHEYDASLILADAVLITLAVIVILWLFSNHGEPGCQLLGAEQGRSTYVWAMIALILWPSLVLAGNFIARVLEVPLPPSPSWPDMPLAPILIQSILWALLFSGALGEESGWRGFALSRLQHRFNPLVASVIIGTFWGLWHVPQHFMNAYAGGAFGALIRIQEIPRAVLFTWLYNRSKGSLLVVMLLHAANNTTSWFLPRSYVIVLILCTLIAVILVVKDRMWERLTEGTGVNPE